MSLLLEALETLYRYRQTRERGAPSGASGESWLDPAHPLTTEEVRQLAQVVHTLLRQELRTDRERHCGY